MVLRVLDEPHRSGAHDQATAAEKDSEHVPMRDFRVMRVEEGIKTTNKNVVPTTQR